MVLSKKVVIIFVGPPGCGKGSCAQILCKERSFIHVSIGDILRKGISESETPENLAIRALLAEGKLVPDETAIEFIRIFLNQNSHCDGYIFDGFPRTIPQAQKLDDMLHECMCKVDIVVKFDVDNENLIQRATGRLIHLPSGRVYHKINKPPKVEGKDDVTGEPLIQREDDNAEIIGRRIESYLKATMPVVKYYEEANVLKALDANKDLSEVIEEIKKLINF